MTRVSRCVNIDNMSMKEGTERYIARRGRELRGDNNWLLMDECTEKYTTQRIAELRGAPVKQATVQEHPYIKRRLAELRKGK